MDQWKGKVALVTGASVGIGANTAVELANAGMIVIGIARRESAIAALVSKVTGEGKIIAKKCDLTVEAEIIEVFKWIEANYGGVDVLINNAALLLSNFMTETPTDQIREIFNLNVVAATICVQETIKNLRKRQAKGHIINLNSILGHRIPDVPRPVFGIYPASKFAMSAINHLIKAEMSYLKAPIKCTSISPGMVDTDLISTFSSSFKDYMTKLQAEDVTAAILYALGTPDRVQVEEIILQAMHHTS
ncbi:farnesol dehydrogenase-like [Culicoides brevitarsis]|uniref:farnesol dehydrogenase-like n=1 Tax=Culicoides brevitarsis TaxID=469753 RepID=UPI00307C057D